MDLEGVQLRQPKAEGPEEEEEGIIHRRIRPRSASYAALRSAVYQLTSLGDFKLEKIGSGFFADVYKVKHKTTGEVLVLKMNKSRKTSKSMLSEIQLMNRLSHPNILKFKGSCVHEGHLHALTEYINGGSLEELLMDETVKLPWSVRLKIVKDIVNGMVYLHSKNVFHRDLNPKNCLIQREKDGMLRTVVADFGLAAKIKQRRRRSHTEAVGSPYWMAPECLRGKNYCEQADVFSFGIMLAEIIARIPADPDFMPRTQKFGLDMEAMRQLSSDCPEKFLTLLDRCCQIDPDDRPTFEEILEYLDTIHLSEDLEEGLKQLPVNPLLPVNPEAPHRDLRACISEPSIRLTDDDVDTPDGDSRSCDSEGEAGLGLVVGGGGGSHQPQPRHTRGRILDSLGSSTGSSCCESVPEEEGDVSAGNDTTCSSNTVSSMDAVGANSGCVSYPHVEVSGIESDTDSLKSEKEDMPVPTETRRTNGLLYRRTSDGNLQDSIMSIRRHGLLQKSHSLNIDSVGVAQSGPAASQQQRALIPLASRACVSSSAQTLVPEDNVAPCNGTRGGDSGIDMGDTDMFKFPPSTSGEAAAADKNGTTAPSSCDQGDNTPVCTSPNSHPNVKTSTADLYHSTPVARGVARDLREHELVTPNNGCTYHSSPADSRFSFSGASSDEQVDVDGRNFTTPPSDHCVSPSWASSEFSIRLPTPSIPWAPPSSPYPSHSLPTSPTHNSTHYPASNYRQRQHRKSYDITSLRTKTSCLRKTSSSQRPQSCRNSALFPELTRDSPEFKKSVHFEDLENNERFYPNQDDIDYRTNAAGSRRPRSKSNPQNPMHKIEGQEGCGGEEGGVIQLKSDLAHQDPHSCKCYNIAQQTNMRLSSSAPDLSKLMGPLLNLSASSPATGTKSGHP